MNELILMVGFPYSGKTTWIRTRARSVFDELPPVVSPDEIRLALHGQRFEPRAERHVWATAHTMVRALFGAGHNIVIVDATHLSRKRRAEWAYLLEEGVVDRIGYVLMGTPSWVCRERAEEAGDEAILPVIERMMEGYEPIDSVGEAGALVATPRGE